MALCSTHEVQAGHEGFFFCRPRLIRGKRPEANRLAVTWRVYHDFGTALVDPRAAVRSKGEA